MAQAGYLNNYFSKPLQMGTVQENSFGTSLTYYHMLNANDTTTLGKEYNTYASSVMNAKEFYNHGVIAHQTKMIGDASWLQMVSYRDWVLSNYKNMLQF